MDKYNFSAQSTHPNYSLRPQSTRRVYQAGQASPRIVDVRGRGLMIGIEFDGPVADLRRRLLYDKHIFTGVAGQNMVRLLPPLCLTREDADRFLTAFSTY